MSGQARTQLLASLADVGVEPDDYALIEQARSLVDRVNARLRARNSYMVFSVTFCATAQQPEQRPGQAAVRLPPAGPGIPPSSGRATASGSCGSGGH
jgi:hypothetical protein